jgi:hypothetical protein
MDEFLKDLKGRRVVQKKDWPYDGGADWIRACPEILKAYEDGFKYQKEIRDAYNETEPLANEIFRFLFERNLHSSEVTELRNALKNVPAHLANISARA